MTATQLEQEEDESCPQEYTSTVEGREDEIGREDGRWIDVWGREAGIHVWWVANGWNGE